MKSTIKSISEIAGVSSSTVSNVLRGKKSASEAKTKKILEIAKKLGYQSESLDTVYFVFYKKHGKVLTNTPFFTSLMEGIERSCRQRGCNMQIYNINCQDGNVKSKVDEILSIKGGGIVLMATEMDADDAQLFANTNVPLVMLDGWLEDFNFNSVLINNSDAAYKAVQYLIEQGHRKIGYLRSSVYINNFFYRFTGFRRAIEKYKIVQDKESYYCTLPPSMDGSYRKMLEYLESAPELPTAFFADNDEIAIGAMKAMQEKGIRIPEQVSIIGMDDMPYSEVSTPTLTTMRVFKEAMGEMAVKMLVDMVLMKYPVPIKIQVGTELIIRESVKKIL